MLAVSSRPSSRSSLSTRRFLMSSVLTEVDADSTHPAIRALQQLLETMGKDVEALVAQFTGEALLCIYDPGEINEILRPCEDELRRSGTGKYLEGSWWLSGSPALRGRSEIFETDARVVRSRHGRLTVFQLRGVFDARLQRFLRVTLRRA